LLPLEHGRDPDLFERERAWVPSFGEVATRHGLHFRNLVLENVVCRVAEDSSDRLAELFANQGDRDAGEVIMTRAEKLIQQGIERGLEKGIEKGIEQGRQEGLEGQRLLLLKRILLRFTDLPDHGAVHLARCNLGKLVGRDPGRRVGARLRVRRRPPSGKNGQVPNPDSRDRSAAGNGARTGYPRSTTIAGPTARASLPASSSTQIQTGWVPSVSSPLTVQVQTTAVAPTAQVSTR